MFCMKKIHFFEFTKSITTKCEILNKIIPTHKKQKRTHVANMHLDINVTISTTAKLNACG